MWFLIACIACMCAYRMGGTKLGTKWRDLGCPAIAFIAMVLLKVQAPWYIHVISFGLLFASLTTYWDSLFGYDNFYIHGLAIGLAYLPYALVGSISWLALGVRAFVLALFMGGLNWFVNKYKIPYRDWIEECGRGFVIILYLLFFTFM